MLYIIFVRDVRFVDLAWRRSKWGIRRRTWRNKTRKRRKMICAMLVGDGEIQFWILKSMEMLAREKEKTYFGTYEKANTHMEKQEEEAG